MALRHLLQRRSSSQLCRINFSATIARYCTSMCPDSDSDTQPQLEKEAVAEENGCTAEESFVIVKESSETKPGLSSKVTFFKSEVSASDGSNKRKSLPAFFRNRKLDQTESAAEHEGTKYEEAISDVLPDFAKCRSAQFEPLSPSDCLLPTVPISDSQDNHLKDFPPSKCETDSSDHQSETDAGNVISNSVQKVLDLKDPLVKSENYQPAKEIVMPRSFTITQQSFELSKEPCKEDAEKLSAVKGLIDFIRIHEDKSNNSSKRDLNSVNDTMQRYDNNDRSTSLDFPAVNARNEDKKTSMLESKKRIQASVPATIEDEKQLKNTPVSRKETEENKVLLRFLRSNITESTIHQDLSNCGEILKVEIPDAKHHQFKIAYIYFKTRDGLEKALQRRVVAGTTVKVESATSMEETTVGIPIPGLIGDPDVPIALVKNPSRTIKIEGLTSEISSHHIEKAMDFCESKISGYFLGSSHSVAYVEFETETGKERALGSQSINVLGKNLIMRRIDTPRTTIVRISNIQSAQMKNIISLCRSLGDVRVPFMRCATIVDVEFSVAEWPNMSKILNRLNGHEMNGVRLQAEPAPVFPPEVITALWRQPEGRKHLKATAHALLCKLGDEALNTPTLFSLEAAIFEKI